MRVTTEELAVSSSSSALNSSTQGGAVSKTSAKALTVSASS